MQFHSSDWLSRHGIWNIVHVPCSPDIVTVRVCSKLKTSWKSVVFTNKVEKNSQYFMGVFNKVIIIIPLCLLLDMGMIIANSALRTSLAIYHRALTKSRGLGMFPGYYECEPRLLSLSLIKVIANSVNANLAMERPVVVQIHGMKINDVIKLIC